VKRRQFITLLGSAAAWPLAAGAQERMRCIGVMMNQSPNDPENMARATAFLEALRQWGWIDRQNIQIDLRWDAGTIDNERKIASELVALSPDVIVAGTTGE
jgi:putative ABC transport system substrate-binding protein